MVRSRRQDFCSQGMHFGPRRHCAMGMTLLEVLIIVVILLLVALEFFSFIAGGTHEYGNRTLSNLKQCGLGTLMYASDNDDRFPQAATWVDEELEYTKKESVFHDPSLADPADYGFAFRDRASTVKEEDIRSDAAFVIQFQTVLTGKNAHSDLWSLPMPGQTRHGDVVCFADGHVRQIVTPPPNPTGMQDMLAADAKAGPP